MRQNCVFSDRPTFFSCAPSLIFNAYNNYKFSTENWCYPYLSWGNPASCFYSEIWTSGMDWNIDYWVVYSKNFSEPKAELLIHFPESNKIINRGDLREMLKILLALFEGKDLYIDGNDIFCYLSKLKPKHKFKGFTCYVFEHASQKPVTLYINDKFNMTK